MNDALLQLGRIETMLTALLQMQAPTMTFREVKAALGYKANSSVYDWLNKSGIHGTNRRYDRSRVIAALQK